MKRAWAKSARSRRRGSVLLAALCFATVLAISVGSYITLCYRSLELSNRAMHLSRSGEMAETGMEEALWALNSEDSTRWDSWTISGSVAQKTLSGFAYGNGTFGEATIQIDNFNGTGGRTITSTGRTVLADGSAVQRTITSSVDRAPLFLNAVAATSGRVWFKSGGAVDSYDSTLGRYETQAPGYSAVIASESTATASATVQITNAQIKGYVATLGTGPSYGSSAKLIGPSTPGTTRIDTSRLSASPYQPVFDEKRASGGTLLPSGAVVTIGSTHNTSPVVYYTSDLRLSSSSGEIQYLTIVGPVILVVSGNLSIADTGRLMISTQSSLRLHVAGDIELGGGGIENQTAVPKNLLIVSDSSSPGTLNMSTFTTFHGVIYTPAKSVTVQNSQAIYGSIVGESVIFETSPQIHYDLSLRTTVLRGIDIPYAVSTWRDTTNGE